MGDWGAKKSPIIYSACVTYCPVVLFQCFAIPGVHCTGTAVQVRTVCTRYCRTAAFSRQCACVRARGASRQARRLAARCSLLLSCIYYVRNYVPLTILTPHDPHGTFRRTVRIVRIVSGGGDRGKLSKHIKHNMYIIPIIRTEREEFMGQKLL